ncbi:Delta(7)-sterol 5(6)-desaturase erg32 [Armadillidium nasatum]|uniref:Delta(7)-sterol 5(6)-desaturase erg32 n=1 Tax=Armadillidium nasatum TaxID=96803 RepID=A0A5N5SNE5_9CRUS|nr:Delta(7)-sterol 5(6)-desaturase erg32 [Armadillidium nasatum]
MAVKPPTEKRNKMTENGTKNYENGTKTYENRTKNYENGTKTYEKVSFKDPMAVTWVEKYDSVLQKYWDKIPGFLGTIIASVVVFILGSTIRGEWLHILVHFLRAFYKRKDISESFEERSNTSDSFESTLFGVDLEKYYLKDLPFFWIVATTVSYVCYFGLGGFLHWYYYVRRRDRAHEWKCQPDKWLSPDLERHEILLGSFSLILGSTMSAIISSYVINGGPTTIYYDITEYGWLWYFLSWPVVFIWQDYLTYWHHRIYHMPFLYKHFHKLHHKYKQPTAFSVTAIHPIEFLHMQFVLIHGTYRQKNKVYREDIFYGKGKDLEECSKEELKDDLNGERSGESFGLQGRRH